jgi:hypothetical protein
MQQTTAIWRIIGILLGCAAIRIGRALPFALTS